MLFLTIQLYSYQIVDLKLSIFLS